MIDVEKRPLRAFQENVRTRSNRAMDHQADVLGDRKDSRRKPLEQRDRAVHFGTVRHLERSEHCVRVRDCLRHKCAKPLRMPQVEHTDAAARDLVLVCRADSPPCRSYLPARGAERIDKLVIRENEMSAVTHIEPALHIDSVGD